MSSFIEDSLWFMVFLGINTNIQSNPLHFKKYPGWNNKLYDYPLQNKSTHIILHKPLWHRECIFCLRSFCDTQHLFFLSYFSHTCMHTHIHTCEVSQNFTSIFQFQDETDNPNAFKYSITGFVKMCDGAKGGFLSVQTFTLYRF